MIQDLNLIPIQITMKSQITLQMQSKIPNKIENSTQYCHSNQYKSLTQIAIDHKNMALEIHISLKMSLSIRWPEITPAFVTIYYIPY